MKNLWYNYVNGTCVRYRHPTMGLNYKKVKFSHQVVVPILFRGGKMKVKVLKIEKLDKGYIVTASYATWYNISGSRNDNKVAFSTLDEM